MYVIFFFQAEDGIRDAQESRGLGDGYKRQPQKGTPGFTLCRAYRTMAEAEEDANVMDAPPVFCLLYTSDAADDLLCVDLGGRPLIKKKTQSSTCRPCLN